MSRTEGETGPGVSGSGLEKIGTRTRLWVFLASLVLTFFIVLAVAFL